MIGQTIEAVIIIGILAFSGYYLYENLPHDPITLSLKEDNNNLSEIYDLYEHGKYSATPVFSPYLRFDHTEISYFIQDSCGENRKDSMKEAFDIFHGVMEIVSFEPARNKQLADILVECSETSEELGDNIYAAGEGGPSKIINTTHYNIIEKGKISLYRNTGCASPVVEIHELCHVFGFDHVDDKRSIMYNISNCDQKITQDMVDLIKDLYSVEPLPDVRIADLVAVKKGKYLDFNISVLNEGLKDIGEIDVTIVFEEKVVKEFNLGSLEKGFRRTLHVTNVKLPSRNAQAVDFYLDYREAYEELDEEDNHAQMVL
jgi:hypothetical protein